MTLAELAEADRLRLTLTVEEAAELLGLSRSSAYRAVARGGIPTIRLGRRLLVPSAKLLALVGIDPDRHRGGDADERCGPSVRGPIPLARPSHAGTVASGGFGTVGDMSESLRLTIVYEEGEDGWIVASVPEVPGAHSQGKTRDEARANVIDALRGLLELRFGEHAAAEAADSESLEVVIGG